MRSILTVIFLALLVVPALAQPKRASISAHLNYDALQPGQQEVIAVVVEVGPGLHAQSHTPLDKNLIPFTLSMAPNPNVNFLPPVYPAPEIHDFPLLGKVSVYTGEFTVFVPLEVKSTAAPGSITLKATATYQICNDRSCFAPADEPVEISTKIVPAGQALQSNESELFRSFDPTTFAKPVEAKPSVSLFGRELGSDAYALAFAGALVVGMIFNVMPCVLPIVPLKAMGFYQAAQEHRGRSLALGFVFALGIIATFGGLAIPVVVLRQLAWGELFGNAWFAAGIVVLLTLMAMGTFGVFNFVLPAKVYELTPKHDTYIGNFLFGILTAILSTPCTFGMFLGLLVWATYQPPVLGTMLVMTVGLGMALPYLLLAAFPELARRFPRTGPWAEIVKQMMAFLLLATAVYFGRRFFPDAIRDYRFWWILFAVIAASALFLILRTIQLMPRPRPITIATVIALLLTGASLGATLKLTYHPIDWVKYSTDAFDDALKSGKPVIVKFTADWCGNCQYVEGTVYTDKRTLEAIKHDQVVMIKADLTTRTAAGWDLLRSLHPVGAIPFTAVYLPGRTDPQKLAGIYTTDDLLGVLNKS